MLSGNVILAVIVSLIVSTVNGNVLRRKITTDSYTYDPDSIIQNEKILRLFLRFASDTANRLIRLKNEAKLRQTSKSHVEQDEPALRIDLFDDDRRIVDEKRRPMFTNASNSDDKSKDSDGPAGFYLATNQSDSQASSPGLGIQNDTDWKNISLKNVDGDKSVDLGPLEGDAESKIAKFNDTEDSSEQPIDVENRMIMNVEKKNYVSHSEHSQTISNADMMITDLQSAQQKQLDIPQTLTTNLAFSEINHNALSANLNPGNTNPKIVIQNAESAMLDQNAETLKSASNNQTGSKTIVDSNLAATAGTNHRTSGSGSNVQSESEETRIKVQGSASSNYGSESAKVSNQDYSGASNHRGQSIQLNPSTQSIPALSVIQDSVLKVTNESVPAVNQSNQMMSLLTGNQKNEGSLDPIKSTDAVLSSADLESVLTNRRSSSSVNPNQGVSPISNLENGMSSNLMHLAGNVVPTVLREIKDPADSIVQISTGKSGELLDGLTDSQSRSDGSSLLNRGTETVSNVGLKNPATSIIGSSVGGVVESGSRLLGSVPLFRSFPDIKEQSSNDNDFHDSVNITNERSNQINDHLNQTNVAEEISLIRNNDTLMAPENSTKDTSNRSPLETNKGNNYEEPADVGLSELELQDFANKFKDALRPVESVQLTN